MPQLPEGVDKRAGLIAAILLAILVALGVGVLIGRSQERPLYAVDEKPTVSATVTPERLEVEKVADPEEEEQLRSPDQQELLDTFGTPARFKLSYLPFGEQELARIETWFYPQHQKKITFVAGRVYKVDKIKEPVSAEYLELRSESFDYSMDLTEVLKNLDPSKLEKVEFVSDLFGQDGVETYVADKVLFTIEQGHLVYMETMGVVR